LLISAAGYLSCESIVDRPSTGPSTAVEVHGKHLGLRHQRIAHEWRPFWHNVGIAIGMSRCSGVLAVHTAWGPKGGGASAAGKHLIDQRLQFTSSAQLRCSQCAPGGCRCCRLRGRSGCRGGCGPRWAPSGGAAPCRCRTRPTSSWPWGRPSPSSR
jgi:hypothetical protein